MQQLDPRGFVDQLETMIRYADVSEDHILAAGLCDALERMRAHVSGAEGLPSPT